jgi:hypothetical protein
MVSRVIGIGVSMMERWWMEALAMPASART